MFNGMSLTSRSMSASCGERPENTGRVGVGSSGGRPSGDEGLDKRLSGRG